MFFYLLSGFLFSVLFLGFLVQPIVDQLYYYICAGSFKPFL